MEVRVTVRGKAVNEGASRVVMTTAAVVRDAIARAVLAGIEEDRPTISERLGPVRLRPHQVDAAARLSRLLANGGGALLADEVGLGKTYVALALARRAERPVVVAPAGLLPMWTSALERVRCKASLVSFERLSRAGARGHLGLVENPDLVIVDEAHHVRTPTTRRYGALAAVCGRSRVLLLSATPLHNSRRDLAAQLALFLGAAAWAMDDAELARYVVRRTRNDVRIDQRPPPEVAPPEWLELSVSDDCLDALLALPPPVPASDGGDGGALLVYSLVRQWSSSRAALRAALRRRLARAVALIASLEAGRYPSRTQLAAWSYAEGAVQLAFPELVATSLNAGAAGELHAAAALLAAVRAHETAVRELVGRLDATPDPDLVRAAALRDVRLRHRGEKVIAFAESAETVEAMFRLLRRDSGVAMLRATGAAVSGGALSRLEALARFAPVAQGAGEPHPSQRIDLLLATDLLSEGVNLQDASVVIHLDLPWNPARLEQRVGRVSRMGSTHPRVSVYAVRPPVAAERLLAVERRLRDKLGAAGRAIGVVGTILPGAGAVDSTDRGAAREQSRIVALLREWRAATSPRATWATTFDREYAIQVAAVSAPTSGFIAAVGGGEPLLVVSLDGGEPSTAPGAVAGAIEVASGPEITAADGATRAALDAITRWLSRRAATDLSGVGTGAVARSRRRVLARITRVASRAPRHLRSVVSPLAADARRAALLRLGEGAERVLAELADAPLPDQAWLRAIGAFGELHARESLRGASHEGAAAGIAALLLLVEPTEPAR